MKVTTTEKPKVSRIEKPNLKVEKSATGTQPKTEMDLKTEAYREASQGNATKLIDLLRSEYNSSPDKKHHMDQVLFLRFSGPEMLKYRKVILETVTGKKASSAQSGITILINVFKSLFEVKKTVGEILVVRPTPDAPTQEKTTEIVPVVKEAVKEATKDGYTTITDYNLPDHFCVVRLHIPESQTEPLGRFGVILKSGINKPVNIGWSKENLFVLEQGRGKDWYGSLVEGKYGYVFFPRQVVNAENRQAGMVRIHAMWFKPQNTTEDVKAMDEQVHSSLQVIKKTPEKDTLRYKRQDNPERIKEINNEKSNDMAKAKQTPKPTKEKTEKTQKEKPSAKPKATAKERTAPVTVKGKIDNSFDTDLEKLDTVAQLDTLVKKLKAKGLALVTASGGVLLEQYEKIKGKTDKDAISYNDGKGKVRVCLMKRYFIVVSPSK